MSKAEVKWVDITWAKLGVSPQEGELLKKVDWPIYDYLWVLSSRGDFYLSRDQGETFNKVGWLRYWLWTLNDRTLYWLSGVDWRMKKWLKCLKK